jgi:hypothetical protein
MLVSKIKSKQQSGFRLQLNELPQEDFCLVSTLSGIYRKPITHSSLECFFTRNISQALINFHVISSRYFQLDSQPDDVIKSEKETHLFTGECSRGEFSFMFLIYCEQIRSIDSVLAILSLSETAKNLLKLHWGLT